MSVVGRRMVAAACALIAAVTPGLAAWSGPAEARARASDGATRGASDGPPEGVRRLLVFVVPDVSWSELGEGAAPHLERFADDAALANLAHARTVAHRAGPADAYLTMGAGTRAIATPPDDGQVLAPDALVYGIEARDLYTRRTGRTPEAPFVAVSFPQIERKNDDLPYDARLGLVPNLLRRAGVDTAVVANADGAPGANDPSGLHREAALALTRPTGELDGGTLGPELLTADPAAPYGVRLDHDAVVTAFAAAWDAPGERVVLVEASDLLRVARVPEVEPPLPPEEAPPDLDGFSDDREQGPVPSTPGDARTAGGVQEVSSEAERDALHRRALADSDRLFSSLLEHVDVDAGDAVLVLGVASAYLPRELGVAMLRTPTTDSGWLRSASTQRAGVISTVDVGPTVLAQFGVSAGARVEGRPAVVVAGGGSSEARRDHLTADAHGARFRSGLLFKVTLVMLVLLIVMGGLLALAAVAGQPQWRPLARMGCALTTALLAASYLTQLMPGHAESLPVYFAWLAGLSVALALVIVALPRAPIATVGAAAALALGVLMVDALTGTHLQFNAVFGYSPSANSRLYGLGNYGFGQIAVGALMLAAMVLTVRPDRIGRVSALGLLAGVLAVIGAPFWGADVGGVLAGTPTFLVFAVLTLAGRIRWRTALIALAAAVPAIALFAALDLARPAERRTHLGRLVERVGAEGAGPLLDVIGRKLLAAVEASADSLWLFTLPVTLGTIALLLWAGRRPLAPWLGAVAPVRHAVISVAVGAVLGSVLNDSGAVVGAVALASLVPLLGLLALDAPPGERADDALPEPPETASSDHRDAEGELLPSSGGR